MSFDPEAPQALLERQCWFGKTISLPFVESVSLPACLEEEAARYFLPSTSLSALRRVEIYHEQYWLRLLRVLHENFPSLSRFLGSCAFDKEIAIPYLTGHPPASYALCRLGETLPAWIKSEFRGENGEIAVHLASIDYAAQKAFWEKAYPLPDPFPDAASLCVKPVTLQPHLSLFYLPYDLFSFRDLVLKGESPAFPEKKESFFLIYRTLRNYVAWEEITQPEFGLLTLIKEQGTLEKACQCFESEVFIENEEFFSLIPLWSRRWISLGWLAFI